MDNLTLFEKLDLNNRKVSLALILFVSAFLLYSSTITHELVNYDDDWLIKDNSVIRSLSLKNILKMFSGPTGTDYLPLKELSYALDYRLFENNPYGYHLTNVILYSATSVLAFLFLYQLSGKTSFSFVVSLLYVFHPIHSEVVNWASARKDCLGGLFFFASALFYAKYLTKKNGAKPFHYLLSLLFFLFSLLSKPSGVMLPFLLFLMAYCFYNEEENQFIPSRLLINLFPFFMIAAFITLITLNTAIEKDVVKEFWMDSAYITFLAMVTVVADYIRQLFFPFNLQVRYNIELPAAITDVHVLFSICFLILLFVTLIRFRKNKWYFFGLAWFFISLVPVSNIIPIAILKADRYIYLPSFGIMIIFGAIIFKIYKTDMKRPNPEAVKLGVTIFIIVLLLSFAGVVLKRNSVWENSKKLWLDTLKKSPSDYLVMNNLGAIYNEEGDYDSAEKIFKKAISIGPEYADPYFNLSIVYEERNDNEGAFEYLNKAIELSDNSTAIFKARINLGNLYKKLSISEKAEEQYMEAIRVKPHSPEGYYNLAMLYKSMNLKDKAYALYKKAIDEDENFYQAYNNLANMYMADKEFGKAQFYFKEAIRLNPKYVEVLNNLATLYIETGNSEDAVECLKKALSYDNKKYDAIIYYNLYKAYLLEGNQTEAAKYLRLSEEINEKSTAFHR
ncbi:MAG: tetratricopeptide repeat protein [Candidatus Schekmanbacteria bacterium]|nr:tetratricopeptide repeat protein [Candidatus Schekmanbacteria bacterium]